MKSDVLPHRHRATRVAIIAALTLLLPAAAGLSAQRAPLGLCPGDAGRIDGFMRAICDGERALSQGSPSEAVGLFTQAAEAQRLQATNELAWAGLAAAYCDARDPASGREWARRYDEARRLWLGELACIEATARPQPRPYVRSRMCTETLAADYDFVRDHPDATMTREIVARLQAVADRIAQHCAAAAAATPATKAAMLSKRKARKPRQQVSGTAASPARGR